MMTAANPNHLMTCGLAQTTPMGAGYRRRACSQDSGPCFQKNRMACSLSEPRKRTGGVLLNSNHEHVKSPSACFHHSSHHEHVKSTCFFQRSTSMRPCRDLGHEGPDCIMSVGICVASAWFLAWVAAALWNRGEYPERIEQPECQYYLKTGTCKFGSTCKYHHPREKAGLAGSAQLNVLNFPLRPGEKDCAYYIRTGNCKFGVTCKFNHPQPVVSMRGSPMFPGLPSGSASAPQPYPTSLPAWPMARPPYLPPLSIAGPSNFAPVLIPPPQGGVSVQTWNPYHASLGTIQEGQQQALPSSYVFGAAVPSQEPVAMGLYPSFIPGHATMRLPTPPSPTSRPSETLYPERPGQPECQYYMRNGECRFGSQCRFHHPQDRSVSSQGSLMGLPLRPGAPPCTFFSRFGFCNFGQTCRFDHSCMPTAYSPFLADVPMAQYSMESHALNVLSAEPHLELAGPSSSREFLGGGLASSSMQ